MKLTDFKEKFSTAEIEKLGLKDLKAGEEQGKLQLGKIQLAFLKRDGSDQTYCYVKGERAQTYYLVRSAFEEKGLYWFVTASENIANPSVSPETLNNEIGKYVKDQIFSQPQFAREGRLAKVKNDLVYASIYGKDVPMSKQEIAMRDDLRTIGTDLLNFEQGLRKDKKLSEADRKSKLEAKTQELIGKYVDKHLPESHIVTNKTGLAALDVAIGKVVEERSADLMSTLKEDYKKAMTEKANELLQKQIGEPEPQQDWSDKFVQQLSAIEARTERDFNGYYDEHQRRNGETFFVEDEFSKQRGSYVEELAIKFEETNKALAKEGKKLSLQAKEMLANDVTSIMFKRFFKPEELTPEIKDSETKKLIKDADGLVYQRYIDKFINEVVDMLNPEESDEKKREFVEYALAHSEDYSFEGGPTIRKEDKDNVCEAILEKSNLQANIEVQIEDDNLTADKKDLILKVEQANEEKEKAQRELEILKQQAKEPIKPAETKNVVKKHSNWKKGLVIAAAIVAAAGVVIGATGHPAPYKDKARLLGEDDGRSAVVEATLKEGTHDLEKFTVSGLKNVNTIVSKKLNTKMGWARKSVGLEPVEKVYADEYVFGLAQELGRNAAGAAVVADLVKKEGDIQKLSLDDYKDVKVAYPSDEGTNPGSPDQMNKYLKEEMGFDDEQIKSFDAVYGSSFTYSYAKAYNEENYKDKEKDPPVGPQDQKTPLDLNADESKQAVVAALNKFKQFNVGDNAVVNSLEQAENKEDLLANVTDTESVTANYTFNLGADAFAWQETFEDALATIREDAITTDKQVDPPVIEHNYGDVFANVLGGEENVQDHYFDGNVVYVVTDNHVYKWTLPEETDASQLQDKDLSTEIARARTDEVVSNKYKKDIQSWAEPDASGKSIITSSQLDKVKKALTEQVAGATTFEIAEWHPDVENDKGYEKAKLTISIVGRNDAGEIVGVYEFTGDQYCYAEKGKNLNFEAAVVLTVLNESNVNVPSTKLNGQTTAYGSKPAEKTSNFGRGKE